VFLEDTGNDRARFVTPEGKFKSLELKLFEELTELEDEDERYLLHKKLITEQQVHKYYEYLANSFSPSYDSSTGETSAPIPDKTNTQQEYPIQGQIAKSPTEMERPKSFTPRGRKIRNQKLERALKKSLGNQLKTNWGEFHKKEPSQLIFPNIEKRVLCKYSSFDNKQSKWFWGVPQTYWANWKPEDCLALILENEDGKSYSYLLLDAEESITLFDKCSVSKREKKINMRYYMTDGEIRIQEWQNFDITNRITPLRLEM